MDTLQALLEMMGMISRPDFRDYTEKSVGDEVEICHKGFLNYLIDVSNDQQLSIDAVPVADDIKNLFISQPMIIVSINENKEFNCGHCANIHYHNIIVYVPSVDRKYYTSMTDVKLIK